MKLGLKRVVVVVAVAAMLSSTANADLLWYDGFTTTDQGGDYEIGDPIAGQSGGTGSFFTGPWLSQIDDPGTLVQADSISRPDQPSPSIGGAASTDSPEFCCTLQRSARAFAEPWGGFTDPDETFYFGFLVDFGTGDPNDAHHRVIEFWDGWDADNPDQFRRLLFGLSSFVGEVGNNLALAVQDSVSGAWERADVLVDGNPVNLGNLAFQGTHSVVMKFDMSTVEPDVISVFLDPVGTEEPAEPNAEVVIDQFLATHMSAFVNFVFNAGGPGVAGVMDELRVGTTFADVANNNTPYVPEPAALSLFGLGMLGLLMTARRRRGQAC